MVIEGLTLGERLKARRIAKRLLITPTSTLLKVKERLREEETTLIDLVDYALSLK